MVFFRACSRATTSGKDGRSLWSCCMQALPNDTRDSCVPSGKLSL